MTEPTRAAVVALLSDPPKCLKFGLVGGVIHNRTNADSDVLGDFKDERCLNMTGVAHAECVLAALDDAGWSFVHGRAAGIEPGFFEAFEADTSADGYYLRRLA